MKALSEKQKISLIALWRNLPTVTRESLLTAAAHDSRLGQILQEIDSEAAECPRASEDEFFERFRVFKDLIGGIDQPPTHARFTEDCLREVEKICDPDTRNWPGQAANIDQQQSWRTAAADSVLSKMESARTDKSLKKTLTDLLGPAFENELNEIACLLKHDTAICSEIAGLPKSIPNFSEELVVGVRDSYERICSQAPEASLWFLYIVTARLEKTAQIFRAVEKIGKRSDDALVSKTDLADIGDLVLANAEFWADQFSKQPKSLEEADAAGAALAKYVEVTVGMTREFGIRKDGRWGKSLFAIRAKASESLESFFKHVEKTFSRALPHPAKGQHGLAKPGAMPDPARIVEAESGLRFLALAGEWASQAAVGSSQKHAADFAREEIDECARALLEILRTAEGEDSDKASEAIALCVRYMRASKDEENAALIQRRAVAVRANAA
ncbi:hypothetical protein [Hyphobacterium sp.]|uniref:hypothetical protein n=1 Tax=Hyphobacterium sp. TaxID=2004662 RepID=UPI003BA871CD